MVEYLRDDRNTRLKLNGRGGTRERSFNGQGGEWRKRKRGKEEGKNGRRVKMKE